MTAAVNKVDMSLDDIIKLNRKKDPKLKGRGGFRKGSFTRGGRGGARRLQRLSAGISPLNRSQRANQVANTGTQGANALAEKRKKAVEALKKAKERVAQLTQQQNRQNVVNQRRGIQMNTKQSGQRIQRNPRQQQKSRGRGFINQSDSQKQFQYENQTQLLRRGQRSGRGRGRKQFVSQFEDRAQNFITRSQQNVARGQVNVARGQVNVARGQVNVARGKLNVTRGQLNVTRGQLNVTRGQVNTGTVLRNPARQRNKINRSFDSDLSSNDGIFTISVNNPTPRKPTKRSKLQKEIQNLKPSVSTSYKFNAQFFANAGTNVSLNDRFASNMERKIFL